VFRLGPPPAGQGRDVGWPDGSIGRPGPAGLGVWRTAATPFFLSAAVLGAGHGLAYLGSQELTDRVAPKDRRAEVFSGFQLGLYVGATAPAIGVGFAARAIGLSTATLLFVLLVALRAIVGLGWVARIATVDPLAAHAPPP
jgi:hypothetical protein